MIPAKLGAHMPVAGRLDTVPQRAADIGARSIQIFLGNPRGWTPYPGDPRVDAAFVEACEERDLPVLIHSQYLINLGSPTSSTYEKSVRSLTHNLQRGREIAAAGVVVHTGSSVKQGTKATAMQQVRHALLPILDQLEDTAPDLLLEPTAGQGQSLCSKLDDLVPYLDALDWHPRAKVCLDTCHLFAAGHDLHEPGAMTALLDRCVDTIGTDRLTAIHANDSLDTCGSFRDRHERIGAGHIGLAPFVELLKHPAVAGLPVILETPGAPRSHEEDIALLTRSADDS